MIINTGAFLCRPYRPDYSGIRHSQAYDLGHYVTPIQGLQFGPRLGNLNKFDSARLAPTCMAYEDALNHFTTCLLLPLFSLRLKHYLTLPQNHLWLKAIS